METDGPRSAINSCLSIMGLNCSKFVRFSTQLQSGYCFLRVAFRLIVFFTICVFWCYNYTAIYKVANHYDKSTSCPKSSLKIHVRLFVWLYQYRGLSIFPIECFSVAIACYYVTLNDAATCTFTQQVASKLKFLLSQNFSPTTLGISKDKFGRYRCNDYKRYDTHRK